MSKLEFTIDIAADRQKVWDTMLDPEGFKEMISESAPGAYFVGNWKKGEDIRFLGPEQAGTLAHLDDQEQYDHIFVRHVAAINSDGTEDRTSDLAKGWIGTTESYTFTEKNGKTELKVEVETTPAWENMFKETWPRSLAKLKAMCEN